MAFSSPVNSLARFYDDIDIFGIEWSVEFCKIIGKPYSLKSVYTLDKLDAPASYIASSIALLVPRAVECRTTKKTLPVLNPSEMDN